jgi:hypothetical protein
MNVQVLGDDVCYDRFPARPPLSVMKRQRLNPNFGDDIMYGGNFLDTLLTFGKGAVAAISSPTGKAMVSAGLTATATRLTPTQKAVLADAQQVAGMQPQVISGGGQTVINLPTTQRQFSINDNLPMIVGGVAVLGLVVFLLARK